MYSVGSIFTRLVIQQMDTHGTSSAPLRVEVVSDLARQDNFVRSRRFRKGDREASKLSTGGRCKDKNSWRSSRRGEKSKPGNSLQAQVEPVVPIPSKWTHTAFRLHHSASRWSQVWYGKIISCRAGGSARVIEKLQSCQRGGGASIKNSWRSAAVAKKRSLVTLCRSKWSPWYLYPKGTKQFRFWRPYAYCLGAFKWAFMDKTLLVARVFHLVVVLSYFDPMDQVYLILATTLF